VIVQTFMPHDPSIQAAARHDYEGFAAQELPLRRQLRYPPYGRMVRIICRAANQKRVEGYATDLGVALRRLRDECPGVQFLGPAAAPVAQVRGRHRFHMMAKCPDPASVRHLLQLAEPLLKAPSGVKVLVDVDPVSML
jgi:primosomal protein N' (replication factor Y)